MLCKVLTHLCTLEGDISLIDYYLKLLTNHPLIKISVGNVDNIKLLVT